MSSSIPPSTPGKIWQPPAPESLASELPQYEILGLLGRGGMGAVYHARQKSLKREVAIKILPPMVEDGDMNFAERFKAEAESMARLNHPGIIAVHDAGETPGGLLYFVMEYVQGTDVGQMILSSGRLPPEHAHAIAAHVCDALAYAHANGLIHRDIKPANIMVDTLGRVKVADFGLAKAADDQHGFTKSNMAVGTPDFVAPEALVTGMPVDGRADLYAMGVMIYQMLTGQLPRGAWQPASVIAPGVDPRFDQIISKAMQYDREARHSSAMELRAHLDSLLMPAVQAPDLQRYSSVGMPKRSPVAGVCDPGGAGQSSGAQRNPPPPRSQTPATTAAKPKTPIFIGLGAAAAAVIAFVTLSGGSKPKAPDPTQTSQTAVATPQRATPPPSSAPTPTKSDKPSPAKPTTAPLATAETSAPKKAVSQPGQGSASAVHETPPSTTPAPKKDEPKPAALSEAKQSSAELKPAPTPLSPSAPTVANTPPPAPRATPLTNGDGLKPSTTLLPPELKALDKQFTQLQAERVTTPFEADVAKLNTSYLGGLDREIAKVRAEGQLDGVLALEAEKKLIAEKQPLPAEDDGKVPDALKALRTVYREAHAKLEAARTSNLKQLTDPLAIRLKQLESSLTQANRIDHAKTVREYRERLGPAPGAPSTPVATKSAEQSAEKDDSVADLKGSSWRKAAEWAVGLGAKIRIRDGKKEIVIKRLADVPKSKFDIVEVDFNDATTDQKRAVRDSGVSLLASQKDLRLLNLRVSSVTNAGLAVLANFPKLETLDLADCRDISGAGVVNLKNPSGLVHLILSSVALTTDFEAIPKAETFRNMKSLTELTVTLNPITSDFVRWICDQRALTRLSLTYTSGLTAAMVDELSSLSKLTFLALGDTVLPAEGLACLSKLAKVEHLILGRTMTDKLVPELAKMPSLTHIECGGSMEFTDAGLAQLKTLKKLNGIDISGQSGVTDAGLDALQKAMPKLKIRRI